MRAFIGLILGLAIAMPSYAGVTIEEDAGKAGAANSTRAPTASAVNEKIAVAVRPEGDREQWQANKGTTLKQVLLLWAKKANWDLQWAVQDKTYEYDYPIPFALSFDGTFDQAAAKFVKLYENAEVPLRIDLNIEQHAARVSIKGKK
jgi:hypothetical protein